MKLNGEQTELIMLTKQLELAAKRHDVLCKSIAKIKKILQDENDVRLLSTLNEFNKNNEEISKIHKKLKDLM
ncbi:MAG: hypothetical protein RR400_00300 [Clostridia bacterium]